MKLIRYFFLLLICTPLLAQNPLIMDQFTADPSARVFDGRLYVYPSHDVPCEPGQGAIGFCMPDYHVFSTENLTEWTDHGVILSQEEIAWVDASSYSLWAPDCIEKDGKYYFYYPAIAKDQDEYQGRWIGVAVANDPRGPFVPEPLPMESVRGIDANPFIDHDGKAYLYWAARSRLLVAPLSEDMLSIVGEPDTVAQLPKGFKEGPYLFEREGIYYFTFPWVQNKTEELAYATGKHPMGPFTFRGTFMDESPSACWTNHHSILEYQGQWYLFYHHNDLSPEFDKNRSIKADSLFFEADGSIRKITPSLRGVGISPANSHIQVDRYSSCSINDLAIDFIDPENTQLGWYAHFKGRDAWLAYNQVDFGKRDYSKIRYKAYASKSCQLEVRLDSPEGALIASFLLEPSSGWKEYETEYQTIPEGTHDLFLVLKSKDEIKLDWISFE